MKAIAELAAVIVCGYVLGWLVGMCSSPVIQGLITALITTVGVVVTGLSGVQREKDAVSPGGAEDPKKAALPLKTSVVPLALMLLGLLIGARHGIQDRVNDAFGVRIDEFAERWKGTNLKADQLTVRLFDELHPKTKGAMQDDPSSKTDAKTDAKEDHQAGPRSAYSGTLFSGLSPGEIKKLKSAKDAAELRRYMRASTNESIRKFETFCSDDHILVAARDLLICPPLR